MIKLSSRKNMGIVLSDLTETQVDLYTLANAENENDVSTSFLVEKFKGVYFNNLKRRALFRNSNKLENRSSHNRNRYNSISFYKNRRY